MLKKQIILSSIILGLMANSVFAFNNNAEIEAKINKALGEEKAEAVKVLIKDEVKKQVNEVKENFKLELKKEENKILTDKAGEVELKKEIISPKVIFINRIAKAKNNEERKKILLEFKEKNNFEIGYKPEKVIEKTNIIFERFDIILNKLDLVNDNIQNNIKEIENKGLDLEFVYNKNTGLNLHLDTAKKEKALAWIKMQSIDFNKAKDEILKELEETKKHLLNSKEEIKEASLNSREIISFLRGLLATIKE